MKTYVFGTFQLLPIERVLLESGTPLRLGSRALDLLFILVEHAGSLVQKQDLIARVWPNIIVEDAALRVHVAALRKVLGDGRAGARYIQNVSGRGYRFVAPVQTLEQDQVAPSAPSRVPEPHYRLLAPLTRIIGRTGIISAVAERVPERRFVTLVGPGGIGKTTVALAVAHRLYPSFADGAQFVDLSTVSEPSLVASTVASALDVPVLAADPMPAILSALRGKQMLLVLDNCEHLVGAVADVTEKMLSGAPRLCILATSREPIRAEGEWVQRLRPLEIPPVPLAVDAASALSFAAIELFVECATASVDTFKMSDADVPIAAEICRRLDGIPLAIELAAARIDLLGLRGLAAALDKRLHVLTHGRRTAPPRHRTLRGTIDWSFQLLSPRQRIVLRRLSVFHGSFDMEAACAVIGDAGISQNDLFNDIADLVAKSLLTVDMTGEAMVYQLMETVRAYAAEQLALSTEQPVIKHRHAEWCYAWTTSLVFRNTGAALRASRMERIDELRSALDWCFAPDGNPTLGVKLTAMSTGLWFQLSLLEELRRRTEHALQVLDEFPETDPTVEVRLRAALCDALIHTSGSVPETIIAFSKALQLADSLNAPSFSRRALWGFWIQRVRLGDYEGALDMARRFCSTPHARDLKAQAEDEAIMAITLHFTGMQRNVRPYAERALALSGKAPASESEFQYCCMRGILARALWIQGFPDQAVSMVQESVAHSAKSGNVTNRSHSLASACAVLLWAGDKTGAAHHASLLIEHARGHSLIYWQRLGRHFAAVSGVTGGGETPVERCFPLDDLQNTIGDIHFLCTYLGEDTPAEAVARIEPGGLHWCTSEVLRVKAEVLLRAHGARGAVAADALFTQSLEIARQQEALSWELRTAMSLARLRRDQGRAHEASELLGSVVKRFTEGFETSDLVRAHTLLDELAPRRRLERPVTAGRPGPRRLIDFSAKP